MGIRRLETGASQGIYKGGADFIVNARFYGVKFYFNFIPSKHFADLRVGLTSKIKQTRLSWKTHSKHDLKHTINDRADEESELYHFENGIVKD